jgi:hypothetical protein
VRFSTGLDKTGSIDQMVLVPKRLDRTHRIRFVRSAESRAVGFDDGKLDKEM